jgi:hypothetical protein
MRNYIKLQRLSIGLLILGILTFFVPYHNIETLVVLSYMGGGLAFLSLVSFVEVELKRVKEGNDEY